MLITPTQSPSPVPNNGYLLIEPANLPAELNELLPEMYPCVPPFLWAAEDSMPRLLRLENLTHSEQEVVSQLMEPEKSEQYPPVVCAWLQTDSSTEELANCLARFLTGRVSEGAVIWRYYDPRVFILTAHLFTDEQGNALLGAVARWSFPWRRQWWYVQPTQRFIPSTADLQLGWPTNSQWELLSKSRVFDRLHARLNEKNSSPYQCFDDLKHSVSAFMETNNYLHTGNDDERAEFAYFSTLYRKLFRGHHELMPKWAQLRRKEISLQQLMACITPADVELMECKINEKWRYI